MESAYVREKAARLVRENRVTPIAQGFDSMHFEVQGDTDTYEVVLHKEKRVSCTCSNWTFKRRICSHILAVMVQNIPIFGEG